VTSAGELPIQDLTGNPAYEALEQEDVEGTDASYREMLEGELRRTSESDPLCGYIHTNLAILDLKMGENESAMAHALPVANGEIASAAAHRVMAMIRVAWLLHQIPDRMRAYQAYSEIERFSTSENVKLRCQVERAGLLMELARSEKGTLAEARALCDQILSAHADSPSGFQRNRLATAALMRAETFYYENDRQAALEALTHVADTYADRRRESSMALYFLAHTLRREGRAEEACEVLENLKNVSLEDGETFARQDLNAKAQRDLVWMLAERGEHTRASQELDRFLARAPSADELRELSERLGTAGDLRTKVDASLATTVSANR
jgi:tetratricopeptide (TPR) repeat protein